MYLQNLGVDSVLVCGCTGEQHSLNVNEKLTVLSTIEEELKIKKFF
ncbi:dihydrodipicolinate synthase family protein [Carnobacterium funditum]